jgi:hypothetical protein
MYDQQRKDTVLLEEEPTMLERESVFHEAVMETALLKKIRLCE